LFVARADRIDRKTLRQDPLLNFTGRATDWTGKNANLAIGIVAAVVVGVVLLVFWSRGRVDKVSDADQRIAAVLGNYQAGEYQATVDLAENMRTSYPGTRAAVLVSFVEGQAQLRLGNAAAAEQAFRSYLDSSAKAPIYADAAAIGLAASMEAQNRYAEAGQQYENAAGKLPEAQADQARLDAARCYRNAGNTAQARTLLEQIKEGGGLQSRRATIELAVLDALGGQPAASAATPGETPTQPTPTP
jgi:tetratricopeptide (TPR) repeat protein